MILASEDWVQLPLETTGSPRSKYNDSYEEKPIVSVTYEYGKCVLRLSYRSAGRFMAILWVLE